MGDAEIPSWLDTGIRDVEVGAVVTVVLAAALSKERLAWGTMAAGALILVGTGIAQKPTRRVP